MVTLMGYIEHNMSIIRHLHCALQHICLVISYNAVGSDNTLYYRSNARMYFENVYQQLANLICVEVFSSDNVICIHSRISARATARYLSCAILVPVNGYTLHVYCILSQTVTISYIGKQLFS